MDEPWIRLGPGVSDVAALGAARAADLLGPADDPASAEALATGDRARLVARTPLETVLRLPLPGTPGEGGVQRERPLGAGTGWVRIHRFHPGPGAARELARARLSRPRSASLAARAWNLACHLQAAGVGTPALVALGELRRGALAPRSFLVVREPEGFLPVPAWLAVQPPGGARRLGLRAVGLALARLFRSGAWLPALSPAEIWIEERASRPAPAPAGCAAPEPEGSPRLRRVRLPAVIFTDLARGRILPRVPESRRRELLAALERALGPGLSRGECARVLVLALKG